ncbi:LptF/LptG family permease [Candidatus Pelagibacter sp.]|nr:LptF/LptG family permease [Candidatus Pelagibacter sp.]
MIKVYQLYLIRSYWKSLLFVSLIFFSLAIILNIFEEVSFFKDVDVNNLYPIFLTLLTAPSIVYETFPFIFFISTQFFFIRLMDKEELDIFKKVSLSNAKLIGILSFSSLIISLILITIFYNLASNLRFMYLEMKNKYSGDNKYLAIVTENGLWIKDEIDGFTNIINAEKIDGVFLKKVTINQFSKNFTNINNIIADEINIETKEWLITKGNFSKINQSLKFKENVIFKSNFNADQINKLFSDLSSLNILQLNKLKKDYSNVGYSLTNINIHIQKLIAYPIYLTVMTIFASVIMLNIKRNKSKLFHVMLGVLLSVLIYYINYFSSLLGQNEKLPEVISIWLPLVIISLFCSIGLVRINEK